jgi:hypothetical protein
MRIERIYWAYMALIGLMAGAVLIAAPQVQDKGIKPFFWILIAVGLFDLGLYVRGRGGPWTMLTMNARVIGFFIGIALMVGVALAAGVKVGLL